MAMTDKELSDYRKQLNEKFKDDFPGGIPDEEFDVVPGSALQAPIDTHVHFSDVRDYITGNKLISGIPIPRFGLLSMKGRNSPMFVYGAGCKDFMEKSNRGFVVGNNYLFVSSLWLRKLMDDEANSNGKELGIVPDVLHQLMHLQRNHTRRNISEKAKDMSIFLDLQKAFGREYNGQVIDEKGMNFCKSIRETSPGFKPGDAEKYGDLAEETIDRLMRSEEEKQQLADQAQQQQQQQQQQQKGQKGQKGQSGGADGDDDGEESEVDNSQDASGQSQPGKSGKPSKGKQGGKPEQGKPGQGNEKGDGVWDDYHSMPMEEFAEVLDNNPDLAKVKDALGIPDKEDLTKIGEIEKKSRLRDMADLQKAMNQKAQMGGKYPGGHIVDAEAERVKADTEGKMSYKLGIRQFIAGEGRSYVESYDVPGLLAYVDPVDMGMGADEGVFIPEEIPAQPDAVGVVLLDTSGSVDNSMISEFLTEIMWLKKNKGEGDTASEIYVFSADTCLRGEPEPITENNYNEVIEKGVNVYGRGGTDFATPLRQLMGTKIMKEKKIAFALYFTDLCASIPKKQDFPANVPIAFICAPNDYNIEFARQVKDWATVYTMEKGVEVDLTEEGHLSGPVDKRPTKGRKSGI